MQHKENKKKTNKNQQGKELHITVGLRTLTDYISECPIDSPVRGPCDRSFYRASGPVSDYFVEIADILCMIYRAIALKRIFADDTTRFVTRFL